MDTKLVKIEERESSRFLLMASAYFKELNSSFESNEYWKSHYFSSLSSNPKLNLAWIVCNSENIGFVLSGLGPHLYRPEPEGYIYDFYIEPDNRGRGFAKHAVKKAVDALKARGARRVFADVIEANSEAELFWLECGFKLASKRFSIQ